MTKSTYVAVRRLTTERILKDLSGSDPQEIRDALISTAYWEGDWMWAGACSEELLIRGFLQLWPERSQKTLGVCPKPGILGIASGEREFPRRFSRHRFSKYPGRSTKPSSHFAPHRFAKLSKHTGGGSSSRENLRGVACFLRFSKGGLHSSSEAYPFERGTHE
jgi:hypothetical protein